MGRMEIMTLGTTDWVDEFEYFFIEVLGFDIEKFLEPEWPTRAERLE